MPVLSKPTKHKYDTRLMLKTPKGKTKPNYLQKLHKTSHVKNHKQELLKQAELTENSRSLFTPDTTTIYFKTKNDAEYYEALRKQTPKKHRRRSHSQESTTSKPTAAAPETDEEAEVAQTPSYEH